MFPVNGSDDYELTGARSVVECAGLCLIDSTCQAAVYRDVDQCLLISDHGESFGNESTGNGTYLDFGALQYTKVSIDLMLKVNFSLACYQSWELV